MLANHFLLSESLSQQLKLTVFCPKFTLGTVELFKNVLVLSGVYCNELSGSVMLRQQLEEIRNTVVPVYKDFFTDTFNNDVSNCFLDFSNDNTFHVYMFFEETIDQKTAYPNSIYNQEHFLFGVNPMEQQHLNQYIQTLARQKFYSPLIISDTYYMSDKIIIRLKNLQTNYYNENHNQILTGSHVPAYNVFIAEQLRKLFDQASTYLLQNHGVAVTTSFIDMDVPQKDSCMIFNYKYRQ